VLLFCIALAPRAVATGEFITMDEPKWIRRSISFVNAMETGDYARTNQTGHPGVTTMWMGATGFLLSQGLATMGVVLQEDMHINMPLFWALLRLPVGIVTSVAIVLAYLLMRRLFGNPIAFVAALLWATDPFLVAHSQLLHVDATLTTCMTIAVLAAMLAVRLDTPPAAHPLPHAQQPVRWGMLVVSAIAGGLAFLTKSPSAILVPMIGLIVFVGVLAGQGAPTPVHHSSDVVRAPLARFAPLLTRVTATLAVWALAALVTWVVCWPAAWVSPWNAFMAVYEEVVLNGAIPHLNGNFFMGRAVADPGPLFYPVAILFRLTPWTLIGGGVALVLLYRCWHPGTRHRGFVTVNRPVITLLVVFVLLFVLSMSILPKKFDRYVLPVFPALDMLAATGLVWLGAVMKQHFATSAQMISQGVSQPVARLRHALVSGRLAPALAVLPLGMLLWYHPYELAYYNPLLGGGAVASHVLLVGWGEGLEQAGKYIAAQPTDCNRSVLSWNIIRLKHYVCNPVFYDLYIEPDPDTMDYAALYMNQLQRNLHGSSIKDLWGNIPPEHVVRLHGIDYAYVYAVAHADFGSKVYLRDYTLHNDTIRDSGTFSITTRWRPHTPLTTDYRLVMHLFDPRGQTIRERELSPGPQPTSAWQPGYDITAVFTETLAVDQPDGFYQLTLQLYDPQSGTALPIYGADTRADIADDGATLLLRPLYVPLEPYFGPDIHLWHHEVETSAVRQEGKLWVHTRWKAHASIQEDYVMFIQVLDEQGTRIAQVDVPPAGPDAPTSTWRPGQPVRYTHSIPLPTDTPPGTYRVALGLYHPQNLERLPLRGFAMPPDAPDAGAHALLLNVELE
jgi:hypothetical protein